MPAEIIDGRAIAQSLREEQQREVQSLVSAHGRPPGLVTILVGENPASVSYVTAKQKRARSLGFHSIQDNQSEDISTGDLLALIHRYDVDPAIDGILVQLPLPSHIDTEQVTLAVRPEKDVDCFHPANVGLVVLGTPRFLPCTPAGVIEILVRSGVTIPGAEVVIVGRSALVGRPLANLLSLKNERGNATVTLCHTSTFDLGAHTRRADILVLAAGTRPAFVGADMVKEGATVIDVATHRIGTTASGKAKLCGDADFQAVSQVAARITPVPGGVGPLTVSMLMANTIRSARLTLAEDRA